MPPDQPHPLLARVSIACGLFPLAVGTIVLIGWWQGITGLTRLFPFWAAMQPVTATGMVLAGIGVLSTALQGGRPPLRAVGAVVAVVLMAAGGATVIDYVRAEDFGLGTLLFPAKVTAQPMRFPGRMSGATAIEFVLLGLVLAMRSLSRRQVVPVAYGTVAATGAFIATIAVLGYFYDLRALYGVPAYTTVAFHTAVSFLVAFLGLLATCPACPLVDLMTSPRLGGTMARRLLPMVFGVPFLLGGVILALVRALEWLPGFAVVVLVVVLVPLLQAGVVMVAGRIDRIDEAREKAIQAMRQAKGEAEQANRAKSQFLDCASHDMRQPVQSLMLFFELLHSSGPGPLPARIRDGMATSIDALKLLLDEFLTVSRLDAGIVDVKPEAVALAPLLARLEADYRPLAAMGSLRFRTVPSRLLIRSDPQLLDQILRRLVDNALRFTTSGGIVVGVRRAGTSARVVVADSGRGIPADKLDAVFEDFYQLDNPERDRAKGLGLGLAVVRRLARMLGHEVTVASTPGRGSRFTIRAEVAGNARDAGPPAPSIAMAGAGLIVVIDDEALVRSSLAAILERDGYEVASAASAVEALLALERRGTPPRLILADYRLRHSCTGIDAIHAIRIRFGAELPALLITGDTAPERLTEARASGIDLLHKPVTGETLRRAVAMMIAAEGTASRRA